MFDIGFAELIIIGVVALLVIGPERLPGTIRTVSLYVNRIRRGFNEIKQEVQQELHNDAVMQELREAGEQLKQDTASLGDGIKSAGESMLDTAHMAEPTSNTESSPGSESPEKKAE